MIYLDKLNKETIYYQSKEVNGFGFPSSLIGLETLEYNKLAKISKDTASSATLILCIVSLIGAIIIFVPKIIELF